MNRKVKNILAITMLLLISFIGITNVDAQSNMKISKKTYINTGIGNRKEAKFYTNKGYAYCITPMKTGPNQGTTLSYKSQVNDGGVRYLLEKTGTSDKSYLITQLAMWQYYNNYLPDTYKKNASKDIVKKAKSLAKTAASHKNDSVKNPSVKAVISDSAMSEVNNGRYFRSKAITIKLTNASSASISVTSPATIINSSGNKITSVKNGQKVYIRVLASKITSKKTFTVNLKTSTKVNVAEKYSPSNSKYQDLVVLSPVSKTAAAKISVTAKPVVRKCEYANNKYYDKNGKVVDKTTYSIQCESHKCEKVGSVYFGKNGNQVDSITYDIQCNKHTCEKVGNVYFGKSGNQVDSTTYDIECNKHTCEKVEDKYFGKDGNEVDSATYDLECNKHTCELVGDKYFGKDGNEVDSTTYDLECNTHICELVGDKHFGKDGKQVDAKKETENA